MSNDQNQISEFLEKLKLLKYKDKFLEEGPHHVENVTEFIRFLSELNALKEIGMSVFEINRFKRLCKDTIEEPAPDKEDIEELYRLQFRRTNLDIKYQIFTTPQPRHSVINLQNTTKMRYFDLINLICIRERDLLGEQLTVELYSCEGYPLAKNPGTYIRNLTDWCLEAYDDIPLLYAIPRPKLYIDNQTLHTTENLPKGKDKLHIKTIDLTIKTNCNVATYYQLCNTIQGITGIPMHLIQIKMNDELVLEKDQLLSALNIPIIEDSVIEFTTTKEFWEPMLYNNFSLVRYHPTWHNQQSVFGTSQFFSCLYALSDWIYNNTEDNICTNTLGHIRNITGCPPLIHSLYLLFSKQNITLPHQVAITEVMIQLFKNIKPKQYKEMGFMGACIQDCEVTEYTQLFWTYFISRAGDNHGNTECYETVDIQSRQHVIDKTAFKGQNKDAELKYNYKRLTTSFQTDEAVVWKRVPMHPLGVELTQEWEQLKQEVRKYPPLCIQPPLQVRSTECTPPAMMPIDDTKIATYIGDAKDGSRNYIYFDVLTGKENQFDVDILDKVIKRNPPKFLDLLKRCDRKPQEEMGKLTRDSAGGISSDVDKEIEYHKFPDQLDKPAITMHKCLTFAMRQKYLGKTVYNATHTKRLLQELAYYAKDPHNSFKIYPSEESIDFWQLILFGPKDTSNEDGIFHLFIEFTDKYPSKPPNIRFITPIYHCNINQAGKVCHSILDRFYNPGIRIRQILDYVYGLLMDPAPDDPLDTVKATELKFNHDRYMNNARAYTAKHAQQYKTAIDLEIKILRGNDDSSTHDSEHMCPLTGELFEDAWNTKYGDSYEHEAILAHIRNVGEYDPFSFAPLKEEDLSPNEALQRLVDNYRKDIENAAKMK